MDYQSIEEVKGYVRSKAPSFSGSYVTEVAQAGVASVDAVKQNNYLLGLAESNFIKLLKVQERITTLDQEVASKLQVFDDARQEVSERKLDSIISKLDSLERMIESEKGLRENLQTRTLKDLREIKDLSKSGTASNKDEKILDEVAKLRQEIVKTEAGQIQLRFDLQAIKASVQRKLEHKDFETQTQRLQIALQNLMEDINQKHNAAPIDTSALDKVIEKFNNARVTDKPVEKTWLWYHPPPTLNTRVGQEQTTPPVVPTAGTTEGASSSTS